MAIAVVNPATGETVETFSEHSAEEIEARVVKAEVAYQALKATDYAQRAVWMKKAADILEEEVDELAKMLTIEMGKPIAQSVGEVLKCAKNARFYADNAEKFLADEPLEDPSIVGASKAYLHYQPLGVVLAVMPWNYPLWQVVRFAAPALMAGNTGLLKHASNVPHSALYLDSLFTRAGFPDGSFTTILAGSAPVAGLIEDRRIKAVTLTGSEPAGRAVAGQAGAHIKPAVMELGGSDAFIVMPSAEIEQASTVAVTARINNNGQSCIAGKRFVVHADVYDEFMDKFVAKMSALVVGDPMDEATQVGPLATERGRDEIAELVDDAREKGATIRTGGKAPEGAGWFYEPTIVDGLEPGMRLVMEEAFGPVASVYKVSSREEAADVANQTTFGLSSALWTGDASDEEYFIKNIEAGAVFVNGMTISYPELPFGGVKDSGFGRELGAPGIREFCNFKTIWKS
ncbi:succinate-semialdehyde dehydrogenase [Pontimonas salivibrio]|uniref:Succinate-semialdehyde dehydrogenase n=1 Tax=Pontimonas salivibrio TaxID=1159327 RepID=A0A2L2BS17_9MICO|nr:NADP-dependent succinic semialdehyde dehydrogenase [Pontimonas salivibrio]AVG24440.1 succinate-semialdehyde dehydrogenase [Pontimonas salivibrio]